MERLVEPEEKEVIINLGALGYDPVRCASILGWTEEEVFDSMADEETSFMKLYNKGKFRSEYVLDLKLFEQAKAGDIKSLDKLEQRKANRK